MNFHLPRADLFIPDALSLPGAVERTTHLGIGAHQDDLEFMALHGILECYERTDRWFGGATCTDGSGSVRSGPFAHFTDEEMREMRVEEQRAAARIGQYSFMAQLAHPSATVKNGDRRGALVEDLVILIKMAQPDVIYTHNPFDKHATHVGVFRAVLDAVRILPGKTRPKALYGCEVWRGLDWLPDQLKVVQPLSLHPDLAIALNGVFKSQISGGKRYDLAVEGRRLANATFLDSHSVDEETRVAYAIDLTPLIKDDELTVGMMTDAVLRVFKKDIRKNL